MMSRLELWFHHARVTYHNLFNHMFMQVSCPYDSTIYHRVVNHVHVTVQHNLVNLLVVRKIKSWRIYCYMIRLSVGHLWWQLHYLLMWTYFWWIQFRRSLCLNTTNWKTLQYTYLNSLSASSRRTSASA